MTLIMYNTKTDKLWLININGKGWSSWRKMARKFINGNMRFYRWSDVVHEFIGVL